MAVPALRYANSGSVLNGLFFNSQIKDVIGDGNRTEVSRSNYG